MRFSHKKTATALCLIWSLQAQAQEPADASDSCWAQGNQSVWTVLAAGLIKPFVCIPLDIARGTTQTATQTAQTQTVITPVGTFQVTQGSGATVISKTARTR